ncbi:MAG: FAD-dependent oxidoreductase, partial [Pseudomonadota bacterium]
KVAAGREAEIRPCVGATYCLDRIYEGGEALCIHNAATGREETMPHAIPRAAAPRRAVVVGAGPAGLEAARVLAARGHAVTVLEAAEQPGGQIRLIARLPRRREMIGIVDWRMAECARDGVTFRFGALAEAEDVAAEAPDLVIVATGGLPNTEVIGGAPLPGSEHAVSSWDILSGSVPPGAEVLLFDDHAGHPGLCAAEAIAAAGSALEIVTPERFFAADIGGLNHAGYARAFDRAGVRVTISKRLTAIRREGNRLVAAIGSDYSDRVEERRVDQIVVEHGTSALDDLYFSLRDRSLNRGELDHRALIEGRPQRIGLNGAAIPSEGFQLFRIGDAVAGRNIHAAIYDALRLCKDL